MPEILFFEVKYGGSYRLLPDIYNNLYNNRALILLPVQTLPIFSPIYIYIFIHLYIFCIAIAGNKILCLMSYALIPTRNEILSQWIYFSAKSNLRIRVAFLKIECLSCKFYSTLIFRFSSDILQKSYLVRWIDLKFTGKLPILHSAQFLVIRFQLMHRRAGV